MVIQPSPTATSHSTQFKILASTLAGLCNPSIAIAASRAGGLGLLDLSLCDDPSRAGEAIDRLARLATGEWGLIVDPVCDSTRQLLAGAIAKFGNQPTCIVLACNTPAEIEAAIQTWQGVAGEMGLLVTACNQDLIQHPAIDFILAKGNEAAGVVGEETSFVLLQRLIKLEIGKPIYVWGGIGWNTAVACRIAGAAGVVLDWQLALTRESPLPAAFKHRLRRMDGTETIVLPFEQGKQLRLYHQAGMTAKDKLEEAIFTTSPDKNASTNSAKQFVKTLLHQSAVDDRLWLVGQDACWAAKWAESSPTVGRAFARLRSLVESATEKIVDDRSLAEGGPLAESHGTAFPIAQGPMTRVSDVPEFCQAVERGGGLPFLALAMLRGDEVRQILTKTRELMGNRSWGVGILGFVPLELRQEQLQVVEEIRPPYAIIAGGRPDQAVSLEALGIHTYLHVPSPAMLDMYVQEGARRFIFEGRECGGHVGPRSSFVLWESMIEILSQAQLSPVEASKTHVLFAGGICDGLSGAMVTALAQPLIERGMKVGVLLGTAYLFTQEATATGAIVDTFQHIASNTAATVLLESSPGHAIRCVPNEYTDAFLSERQLLKSQRKSGDEIREVLERGQLGRLRVASKGIQRTDLGGEPKYVMTDADAQRREGMYMIGQVAPLCAGNLTIRQLHERVSAGTTAWLTAFSKATPHVKLVEPTLPSPPPLDIAVVGMSCLLPGADTPEEFWQNILEKRDLLEEVPQDRFEVDRWFDSRGGTRDKINSKSGGFLKAIPFDPLKFGIPPASLRSIEPVQLLALELVDRALKDAGYGGYQGHNPHKQRSSIILGAGGGAGELSTKYVFRAALPQYFGDIDEALLKQLPEWTEDSFAGILMNVIAGRVANRFDFGGVNFTVDAACASSLAAIYLACRELSDGTSDMVIAGGCDTGQTPFGYLCFATAGALSPTGKSRPFDQHADGIAISEGLASVVLKRAADAERDGDRIYAIIRAAAGGSDGRSKGMTAPRIEGQVRTFERAYQQARFSPATVELFEAHGTGTAVGDRTECQSLKQILDQENAPPQQSAIGSVKSNIGHTKCTAGVAGLMKAALALHHRVLPPTIHVDSLDPEGPLVNSSLYANTELRPWIRSTNPRRAGVSSFGFGGTNFHVVMEEYEGEALENRVATPHHHWPTELCVFTADGMPRLIEKLQRFLASLGAAQQNGLELSLVDVAYTLFRQATSKSSVRIAVMARDVAELLSSVQMFVDANVGSTHTALPKNVYFTDTPLGADSPLAMLFPGQGSQSPNMLRALATEFDEVRGCFEHADGVLQGSYDRALSRFIFPVPTLLENEIAAQTEAIKATHVAQPALGTCCVGVLKLYASLEIHPASTAGHSYGELVALYAAGCLDETSLYRLSHARGRAMSDIALRTEGTDLGSMMAVGADETRVRMLTEGLQEVWVANLNSPQQTVMSGSTRGLAEAEKIFAAEKLSCVPLPVACAFHTPIMAPAQADFYEALRLTEFGPAKLPVFANVDATIYPTAADGIRRLLSQQLLSPVRFVELIENMYAAGNRVFLEMGPGDVLTRLVGKILGNRPHVNIASQSRSEHGITAFLQSLGQLFAHGIAMNLERLFEGRHARMLDFAKLAPPSIGGHCWMVDGARARPLNEAALNGHTELAVVPTESLQRNIAAWEPGPGSPTAANPTVVATREPAPVSETPHTMSPLDYIPVASSTNTPTPEFDSSENSNGSPYQEGPYSDPYAQFQDTMRQFLETQQSVMTAFLGGTTMMPESPEIAVTPTPQRLIPVQPVAPAQPVAPIVPVAETTPVPVVPPLRAEIAVAAPAVQPQPVFAPVPIRVDYQQALTEIVSERTGYPADMLDPQINLESELGIDSIKRVEIIAAFRRSMLPNLEEPPTWFMERMTAAKSIIDIADGVKDLVGGGESNGAPSHGQNGAATNGAVPAAKPIPVAAQPVAAQPVAARVDLVQALTEIVSERTGYPADMLDPQINLESELGIDSIKRVEIIAAFRRSMLPNLEEPPTWFMERMTAAKSIIDIADGVKDLVGGGESNGAPSHGQNGAATNGAVKNGQTQPAKSSPQSSPRCVIEIIEAPLHEVEDVSFSADGVIVLTDDGHGIAQSFAADLMGAKVAILDNRSLESREAAMDALSEIRRTRGEIIGVVHLQALRPTVAFHMMDEQLWFRHVNEEVKSILFLMQAFAVELNKGAFFACVSSGGGDFDKMDPEESKYPWRGGLAGLLKCAAKEWPQSKFRAIDVDQHLLEAGLPQAILREWEADGPVEIGYRAGKRLAFRAVHTDLDETLDISSPLDSSSVVLITGGGRGITAQIAIDLAQRAQPTLVLLGRTSAPVANEDPGTANMAEHSELRKVLLAQARAAGENVIPKDIESRLRKLLADREIRETLAAINAAGSRVVYECCDVRDTVALEQLIARVQQQFGPINAVIHGSGVIEDKYILDKTSESFDRVVETKTSPAITLARLLDPQQVKLFMLFSSVAGFYGNPGQCDYAAANEMLNRIASHLNRIWPGKVVAMNWGPWSGAGMVTPEVAKQFDSRGIGMVSVSAGRRAAWLEALHPDTNRVSVLIGAGPWVNSPDGVPREAVVGANNNAS